MIRFPPRRVLVAADFGEASLEAWRQAVSLAAPFGAQVRALHARAGPGDGVSRRRLASDLRKRLGAPRAVAVKEGEPVTGVLRAAASWKADLVAVGTRGRTGVFRWVLGSTAEAILRRCRVPVLAVRREARPIRSVLAPVNFTSYSDFGFLYAAAVAYGLGARLTVQNVVERSRRGANPNFFMTGLVERLPEAVRVALQPRLLVSLGEPTEEIPRAARRHDLVVLSSHRRSALHDAVLGTTLERVLRRSPAPVLSVPVPPGEAAPPFPAWRPERSRKTAKIDAR